MPYKKPERVPFQGFAEFLKGKGFNSIKLAGVLGCSPNTAMKKLKSPELINLQDIAKLYHKGHLSLIEMREAIKL